jgi:glycosyltransferase involved in cell wall biosynthesis
VPARVFTVHGWAFKATSGASSTAYLWADRLMRPLTTATICVSETERRAGIAARTCGADATVIANAVDVTSARRSALDGAPPRVLSVGRLKEPKDFVTLARALHLLDAGSFSASIAGDGPDRDAVERALAGAGAVLGERDDVPALLASSDVFVLSSTSEGMPMTVIEAMAAGLPVVASDVGGLRELVDDGVTGLLVPPRDARALAAALSSLLEDAERRRAMGDAGRARAEALFDLPRFRSEHLALYERLLAPKRARR